MRWPAAASLLAAACALVAPNSGAGQASPALQEQFLPENVRSCTNSLSELERLENVCLKTCEDACKAHGTDCAGVIFGASDRRCYLVDSNNMCDGNGFTFYRRVSIPGTSCGLKKFHIIWVLDESGSVGDENFELMEQFVVDTTASVSHHVEKQLDVVHGMTFSTLVRESKRLGTYNTSSTSELCAVESQARSFSFDGGHTNIFHALQVARDVRTGLPGSETVVVVLLTDGQPTRVGSSGNDLSDFRVVERTRESAVALTALPNTFLVYARIIAAQEDLFDGIQDVATMFIGNWRLDEFVDRLDGLIGEAVCNTEAPTRSPTPKPTTNNPTRDPTKAPTSSPSRAPTTLPPSVCTVEQAADAADIVTFPNPNLGSTSGANRFVASSGAGAEGAKLFLSSGALSEASLYVFTRAPINLVGGFIAEFDIALDSRALDTGFAFVIHRRPDELDNIPIALGSGLGFRNIENSVAVVFDRCTNRDDTTADACRGVLTSLRYSPAAGHEAPTSPRFFDYDIPDTAETVSVHIKYVKERQLLQVSADGNLIVSQDGFVLEDVTGGIDAFVGFTTATGQAAVRSEITSFNLKAVGVVFENTLPVDMVADAEPVPVVADGKSTAGFSIQLVDACLNNITFGGAPELMQVLFVEIPTADEDGFDGRRVLQAELEVVEGVILDNKNGVYTGLINTTKSNATFAMFSTYGEGCSLVWTRNADGTIRVDQVADDRSKCFWGGVDRAIESLEPPAPPDVPDNSNPAGDLQGDEPNVMAIAIGGGAAATALVIASVVMARYRRKWRSDKAFIDAGKIQNLEKAVVYHGDETLAALHSKMLSSRQEVLREKAQREKESKAGVISDLERENRELMENVRINKVANQQTMSTNPQFVASQTHRKEFAPPAEP